MIIIYSKISNFWANSKIDKLGSDQFNDLNFRIIFFKLFFNIYYK